MKYPNMLIASASLCLMLTTVPARAGQDRVVNRLSQATALYESAEFDAALAALKEIDSGAITPEEQRDKALYAALCLLALDRKTEAETTIEQVVRAEPLFRPATDMPPRLRAVVEGVRGRLRPSIAQQHYVLGKKLFDRGDYEAAFKEFSVVVELTNDERDEGLSPLRDVWVLAAGFRDLTRHALDSATPSRAAAPSAPVATAKSQIVPPVVIRQDLPALPPSITHEIRGTRRELTGLLDIVVGEHGDVESVEMLRRIHPHYDLLLLEAARQWKYQPATRQGKPVQYVKRLAVNVTVK
jgi:tetratricopeptide (TPR) repeat protein